MQDLTQGERKNVIVTGGAGFIGSHLCEFLLQRYNVICIDNFSTGSERNIDHLLAHPHFEFLRHDIAEGIDFKSIDAFEKFHVAYTGISQIYHLASPGSPAWVAAHPIETMMTLALGTRQILEIARTYDARLVYVSDILASQSMTEEFDEVIRAYANGLRFAEHLCEQYEKLYSVSCSRVRLGSVYGPLMSPDDSHFISSVISCALQGKQIQLPNEFDKGAFLYITDAVEALEKIMQSEEKGDFEVAAGTLYPVREVIEKIFENLGAPVVDVAQGAWDNQTRMWALQSVQGNIEKLKENTGWFPVVVLNDGLAKTIAFMDAQRHLKTMTH
jgi:UDP-glucuronate decarboxylase